MAGSQRRPDEHVGDPKHHHVHGCQRRADRRGVRHLQRHLDGRARKAARHRDPEIDRVPRPRHPPHFPDPGAVARDRRQRRRTAARRRADVEPDAGPAEIPRQQRSGPVADRLELAAVRDRGRLSRSRPPYSPGCSRPARARACSRSTSCAARNERSRDPGPTLGGRHHRRSRAPDPAARSARSRPRSSATRASRSGAANSSRSPGLPAPASRRCCTCSDCSTDPTSGTVRLHGQRYRLRSMTTNAPRCASPNSAMSSSFTFCCPSSPLPRT